MTPFANAGHPAAGGEARGKTAARIAAALRYLAGEALSCGLEALAVHITAAERTARAAAPEGEPCE